jgi:D-alanyl-D-alanine carboxypeptidase/D-alanyl-D-alanine-endopeptidase (penicillin-binding protein 4)
VNKGTTVADSVRRPLSVTRLFRQRQNTILVEGELLQNGRSVEETISVWRPELYTAELFKEALQRKGIAIGPGIEVGQVPIQNHEIAVHYQRIDSSIVNLNKISDNLTAEMLLKTVDAVVNHSPGSSRGGLTIVNRFVTTLGVDTTQYRIVDGSGLSFYNLVSAEILVKLLDGMQRQTDIFPLFYESLPIAGVDGTIRNRMKKTPAEANLRAKTGTISGVGTLSGYVQSLDGERLIFSMMMQNFVYPSRYYQSAQDKIGAILAGFSRYGLKAQPTH